MLKKEWKYKLFRYKRRINAVANIAKSFSDFAVTKSPLSFISGAYEAFEEAMGLKSHQPGNVFNAGTGWYPVFTSDVICRILASTLKDIESEALDFEYDTAKLYKLDNSSFVVLEEDWYRGEGEGCPLVLSRREDKAKILASMVDKKVKELGSNYIELTETDSYGAVSISTFPINVYDSQNAKDYVAQLENAYSKDINRSFVFYGLPGTGKTTLAYNILNHFQFRTLKFKPSDHLTISVLLDIVKLFKIEAIILDDIDRIQIDEKMLNFLDTLNREVKLIIGICNNLSGLDPALLRPGRFDEIIKISSLDDKTIESVLKEIYEPYKEKVKGFPIAYLNELYKQYILNKDELPKKFEDLKDRVERLVNSYGENNDSQEDEAKDENQINLN